MSILITLKVKCIPEAQAVGKRSLFTEKNLIVRINLSLVTSAVGSGVEVGVGILVEVFFPPSMYAAELGKKDQR